MTEIKTEKQSLDEILREKKIGLPDDFYKYLTEISTNCLINVDYCTNNHYAQKIVYPNFYTSDKIS